MYNTSRPILAAEPVVTLRLARGAVRWIGTHMNIAFDEEGPTAELVERLCVPLVANAKKGVR